jgi:hypothetical protein
MIIAMHSLYLGVFIVLVEAYTPRMFCVLCP